MLKPRSVAKTHIHTPTQRPDFPHHTPDNYDDVFCFWEGGGGGGGVVVCGVCVCGVWCVVCGVWCVGCGVCVLCFVFCFVFVFVFVFAFAFVSGIVTLLHDDSRPCCVREPRGGAQLPMAMIACGSRGPTWARERGRLTDGKTSSLSLVL